MATFRGTNLRNKLVGGAFGDTLLGLGGNDTLLGNSGADLLRGGTGNDTMDGGTGNDRLFGETGNDIMKGGSGADKLDGGTGNDRLDGGANNDALTGGLGNDVIIGGTGIDTAYFGGLASASTITQVGSSLIIKGANGVDVVGADVEFVRFSNGVFSAAAKVFKLTTSNDTFTGGLRNDTFTSLINTQFAPATTYSGADVLDGGGGTGDLLQISIAGINSAGPTFTPPISISNIEIVKILNQESNGGFTSFDASIWNGVTNIVAESGVPSAVTEITSLGNLVIAEMKNNSSSLIIEYDIDVLAGLNDVQNLILSANNGGTFEVAGGTAETLAIVSQGGTNSIVLDSGHTFGTITVAGNQHLEIEFPLNPPNPTAVTTFNAASMTGGGVTAIGLDAASGVLAITGSLANDEFVLVSTFLDSNDAIGGGGGTGDLLGFLNGGSFSDASFTEVSAFEILAFGEGASAVVTLDAEALDAGFERVNVYDDGTEIDLTVLAGFTRSLTVDLDALDASEPAPTVPGNVVIDASALDAAHKLTVLARAGSIAGHSIVAGTNTGDELVLTADDGTANLFGARGFETITVKGGTGSESARDIGIYLSDDAIVASGQTLVVTAGGASGLVNAQAQLFFDGSLETDGAFNVTGGAGADDITGGSGNDNLSGGASGDILTAGFGDDTLTGGDGDDVFDMEGNLTAADSVNGGNGTADELYSSSSVLLDTAFTNVIGVEILELGLGGSTVTLDEEAQGAGAGATGTGFNRVITSGANNTINVEAGFLNALTVDIRAGGDVTVDALDKASGAVTILANASNVTASDNIDVKSSILGNTIQLVADNGSADLSGFSGFSTLTVLAGTPTDSDIDVIVGADSVVATGATLTVNATALTSSNAILSFDGAVETDGQFSVLGGAGSDSLRGGNGNDTLSGGAGNDAFTASIGNDTMNGEAGDDTFLIDAIDLTLADVIDGGAQVGANGDVLTLIGGDTIDDTDLTGVSNVETLVRTHAATTAFGAQALNGGNGIKRYVGSTGNDVLNIAAGYTGAITVDLKTAPGGSDTIDASLSSAAVTLEANAGDVTGDTLKGGTSAGDVLRLTADGNTATLDNETGFETITIVASGGTSVAVTIASDTVLANSSTMTVNASALTSLGADFTFNGNAITTTSKAFNVTGGSNTDVLTGGAGADALTGGAGSDVLIGGDGIDTLNGGADNDVIEGGLGNDIINAGTGGDTVFSGLGNDTIDLGSQTDIVDIDVVVFSFVTGVNGVATVSNFNAETALASEDLIEVASGSSWAGGGLNEVRSSTGAVAQASIVFLDNNPGGFLASFDAVTSADAIQTGSASGESYLFVWNDTQNRVHVSYATVDASGDTAVDSPTDLAILTGVSIANLTLADFNFA